MDSSPSRFFLKHPRNAETPKGFSITYLGPFFRGMSGDGISITIWRQSKDQ